MERSQLAVVSAIHDDADTQKLLGELENAGDPLEVLTAIARWAGRPEIYAWLMLPVTGAESAVYLVSQHTLPKQNVRGLIEEFLYAVGSTASAYGASVPASDVIEIRNAALHEGGNWQPMIGAAFNDVGLVARGKLRAVVRICFSGDGSPDIAAIAQDVARIAAPYVDACLLACSAGSGQPEQSRPAFLSCTEFRHRLDAEVAGIRQKPHELSLLRVKLQPRKELLDAAEVERAYTMARALTESSVRDGDVVGLLDDTDLGVLMPNTGPRGALIGAMRISDILAENPTVTRALDHFIGVSGWTFAGSDAEGLIVETDMAATQAQSATACRVHLYT